MDEKTLLGKSCCGTEIYGKRDKISVHTNRHSNFDGTYWGWLEGCSKHVCWSDERRSGFTQKDAYELANKWNKRHSLTTVEPDTTGTHKADSECGAG